MIVASNCVLNLQVGERSEGIFAGVSGNQAGFTLSVTLPRGPIATGGRQASKLGMIAIMKGPV